MNYNNILKEIEDPLPLLADYPEYVEPLRYDRRYNNLSQDFNVFLVGDATLATYPASTTPKYATQVVLANAAMRQMITQVNWVRLEDTSS